MHIDNTRKYLSVNEVLQHSSQQHNMFIYVLTLIIATLLWIGTAFLVCAWIGQVETLIQQQQEGENSEVVGLIRQEAFNCIWSFERQDRRWAEAVEHIKQLATDLMTTINFKLQMFEGTLRQFREGIQVFTAATKKVGELVESGTYHSLPELIDTD